MQTVFTLAFRQTRTSISLVMLSLLASTVSVGSVDAQQTSVDSVRSAPARRAELEALAAQSESIAVSRTADPALRRRKRAEAESVRERLSEGDFQVGDRIVVLLSGGDSLSNSDTVTIRAGQEVGLRGLPAISLHGVLRSELQDYLTAQVGRYLRSATVQASSLVRMAILGAVQKPGYYALPADILVSDAIMIAGGPDQSADLNATVIARGSRELWNKSEIRHAINSGMTLDQLGVRAGDEITVGVHTQRDFKNYAYIVTALVSLSLALTRIL